MTAAITFIRSVLYFLLLSLTTVLIATPLALLGWMLPYRSAAQFANTWGHINLWLQKWICGLTYEIKGWENFPDKNCIVFSNHQSAWETISLRALLPPEQTWVLKRELLWVPFFGWAVAVMQPIAIDRSSGRKAVTQVIRQGKARLADGRWVIIFPEGTRVATGEKKKFGIGGALLAEKSGYPVLPIAHNAGVFWRRRGINKYPGKIQVVIGPLIHAEGLTAIEINQKAQDWIQSTVHTLPNERS